jgi:hypothetical protein
MKKRDWLMLRLVKHAVKNQPVNYKTLKDANIAMNYLLKKYGSDTVNNAVDALEKEVAV